MKEKGYADVLNSDIQSAESSLCEKDSVCRECESFSYPLMEQFLSLQGEGFNTGKAAYFIRLAGCNVRCDFCDVKQSWNVADRPLASVGSIVDNARKHNAVNAVVTGGEPLLYDLNPLTRALKAEGICTWLETSASKPLSGIWDWICISPKTKRPPLEENMIYEEKFKIGLKDVWAKDEVSNIAILEYLEDIAAYHSDSVGIGVNTTEETHVNWLLLDWELEVLNRPKYGQVLEFSSIIRPHFGHPFCIFSTPFYYDYTTAICKIKTPFGVFKQLLFY